MDNFVAQLRHNINIDPENGKKMKSSKFRELLYYVSTSSPEICDISKCNPDGDIQFEVPMRSMGVTYDLLVKYKKEICSEFMANFLGELLIREHFNSFAQIITSINPELYPAIVNRFEHRKFGMDINKDRFVFCFHISLLQEIMLEDIKKQVK